MSGSDEKKWLRRRDDRPGEIIAAATQVFVERGFAGANLDEVAQLAGIAKGTLYRYFDGKDELFRAVVQDAAATHLQAIEHAAATIQGSLARIIPLVLSKGADESPRNVLPALARLVVGESHAFPDLAKIWHANVVGPALALLTALIGKGQARGEIRPGDPTLHAFSIIGPLVAARLFHEVFGATSTHAPNLAQLATQHAETVLRGLSVADDSRPEIPSTRREG